MSRNYNHIYKKLVQDESDVFGHIAYSIYKESKIEYIEKFKQDHGAPPTDDELQPFNDISCTDASIKMYKMKAEAIVADFAEEVLAGIQTDMENDYIRNYDNNLKRIIEPLKPLSRKEQFWRGVWQSVLGAFLFAIIVAAFVFITTYNKGADSVKVGSQIEHFFSPKTQQPADSLQ